MTLNTFYRYLLVSSLLFLTAVDPAPSGENSVINFLGDPESYSVPFEMSERLRYEVRWKPFFFLPSFKAGELDLSICESDYQEKPVYKISASVTSDGAISSLSRITFKAYFESIIDRYDFRSYRTFSRIQRNKRRRNVEVSFDYVQDHTHLREIDFQSNPPEEIRNEINPGIPGPVADFLSVFYIARLRCLHPGEEFSIHFSSKGKINEVRVKIQKKQQVETVIGSFDSVKIQTGSNFFKGGGRFRIWYSKDSLRLPIKFEASVKFGKFSGKLTHLETPRANHYGTQKTNN